MAPTTIPSAYSAFFLWIEPFFTLLGAVMSWFRPQQYLEMTDTASAAGVLGLPVATHVALRQLGNMYLAFALNEALVLRATTDTRVWRTLLVGLLMADFGHLYSLMPLGSSVYYDIKHWNAIDWGNIAFVYCGATMRICFLAGVGHGVGLKKARSKARNTISANGTDIARLAASPTRTPKKTRGKKSKG